MKEKTISIIKNGSVIFTIITLLFYTIGYFANIIGNLDIKFIWLFFIFSILLACANNILKISKFNIYIRYVIHFFITSIFYIIVVVLCGGFFKNGSYVLVSLLIFLIIYVIYIFFVVISYLTKKKKTIKEYKKQF